MVEAHFTSTNFPGLTLCGLLIPSTLWPSSALAFSEVFSISKIANSPESFVNDCASQAAFEEVSETVLSV